MKILINEITYSATEHEVEFPIFRKHDFSDEDAPCDTRFSRIDHVGGHLRQLSVHLHDHDWNDKLPKVELEVVEPYFMDAHSSLDYNLGRGHCACTADEFYDALEQAQTLICLMQGAVRDAQKPVQASRPNPD